MGNIRHEEGRELGYICGRCGLEQNYLPGEEKPECTDCGWPHFAKKPTDIPSEIKLSINDY